MSRDCLTDIKADRLYDRETESAIQREKDREAEAEAETETETGIETRVCVSRQVLRDQTDHPSH